MPLITDVQFPTLITPKKKRRKNRGAYTYRSVQLGRQPTPLEERLLSLEAIPLRLDAEIAGLVDILRLLRTDQLADLTTADAARDLTEDIRAILTQTSRRLARYGAFERQQEYARQGHSFSLTDDRAADFDLIDTQAGQHPRLQAVVDRRTLRLTRDWQDELHAAEDRVRRAKPFSHEAEWHDLATRSLDIGLWAAARAVINTGFAGGRSLERQRFMALKKHDEDLFVERLVFSAVLDKNTCDECYDADGTEFDADSHLADLFEPPYYKCLGGENCRCQLIAVEDTAALSDLIIEHFALIHLDPPETVSLDSAAAYKAWETRGRAEPRPVPIKVKKVKEAVDLILQGKVVELDEVHKVATVLDRLHHIAKDAIKRGGKAPNYDLCNVTVAGTNIFCASRVTTPEHPEGIPRIAMPQFGGTPTPGTAADRLPKDETGRVDGGPEFMDHLHRLGIKTESQKVKAAALKASQAELYGPKIADKAAKLAKGKEYKSPIFISRDNYVVDGHHRWAAQIAHDAADNKLGDIKMHVIRIDAPISEILHIATKWSKRFGITSKSATAAVAERAMQRKVAAHADSAAWVLDGLTPEDRSAIAVRAWDTRGRGGKDPGHNVGMVEDSADESAVDAVFGGYTAEDVAGRMIRHTDKRFDVTITSQGGPGADPEILREQYDEYVQNERDQQEVSDRKDYVDTLSARDDEISAIWQALQDEEQAASPYGDVSEHPALPGIELTPVEKDTVPLKDLIEGTDISSSFSADEKDAIRERLRGTGGPEPWSTDAAKDMFSEQYDGPDPTVNSFERWARTNGHNLYDSETAEVEMTFNADDGTTLTRIFKRDEEGEFAVDHNYFKVSKNEQGSGLAKDILRGSFEQYKAMGVDKATVHANIDVGGYAWARFGFKPNDPETVNDSLKWAIRGHSGLTSDERAALNDLVDEGDSETAIWRVADAHFGDRKIGKELLLNFDWYGTLRLDDHEAMGRLNAYLNTPTTGHSRSGGPSTSPSERKAYKAEMQRVKDQRRQAKIAEANRRVDDAAERYRKDRIYQAKLDRKYQAQHAQAASAAEIAALEKRRIAADEKARAANRKRLGLAPLNMADDGEPPPLDPIEEGGFSLFYIDEDGDKADADVWDSILGEDRLPTDRSLVIPNTTTLLTGRERETAPLDRSEVARRAWDTRGRGHHEKTPVTISTVEGLFGDKGTLEGEDLTSLAQNMFAAAPEGIRLRVTNDVWLGHVDVLAKREASSPNADDWFVASRRFEREADGTLVVHHENFHLPKSEQGAGIARDVLRDSMKEYQKLGVNYISTQANVDVGSYAWAKFGFKAAEPYQLSRMLLQKIDYLKDQRRISRDQHSTLEKLINDNQNDEKLPWLMADYKHDGVDVGRSVMMNLTWQATLRLNDRDAMDRFNKYVNKPHR